MTPTKPAAAAADAVRSATLRSIADTFGTPLYVYDLGRVRRQVERLRAALPAEIEILYSLKANPSLGLCGLLGTLGLGADVASAGELAVASAAQIPERKIFVAAPFVSPAVRERLADLPRAVVSVDSVDEWRSLAATDPGRRLLVRLRPDFASSAVVDTGRGSRFGVPLEELAEVAGEDGWWRRSLAGFHVYAGSQITDSTEVVRHLERAFDLAWRAADRLGVEPAVLNLGGGFGVPYRAAERELDLAAVGSALAKLAGRAGKASLVLELGRYLVAQAGWYVTRVTGRQSRRGRAAVVVDGGVHQRADICGLGLEADGAPPLVLGGSGVGERHPTDVLGCLCLPEDVLTTGALLPPLAPGDLLGWPNAGAYGLTASPGAFLSHPRPAEVAFEGDDVRLLRAPGAPEDLLDGQLTYEPHAEREARARR